MGDLQLHHSDYLPERSLYDTIGSDSSSELEEVLHQLSLYPQLAGRSFTGRPRICPKFATGSPCLPSLSISRPAEPA